MGVRSVVLLRVGKDFGVVMLEMKVVGLRELDEEPRDVVGDILEIEREVLRIMPELSSMSHADVVVEDGGRRFYVARLYLNDARVEYVLLISPKNSLRGLLRRFVEQGWSVRFLVEKRTAAKKSYWR
ncbi:MAG: hypothetical protein RXQ56_03800 [Thermoproteus sp.]|jgi:hypothetical protein|nr:hypothetical protein [Thermoproteus sp.]MDT7882294.1 hypothetical protein [Thermoproteus sp.]